MRHASPIWVLAALLIGGCAHSAGRPPADVRAGAVVDPDDGTVIRVQVGVASYVGPRYEGRRTASGEVFDGSALEAAHRTLPFGTRVRVVNLANQRSVVVTVVDRGPFHAGRVIDLSRRAARELDFVREGTTQVRLEVLADRATEEP
ncbi:MAG: septal ring lytic transglycosylase RlpA family protein [Candidatus Eisenbacteria bacterium]